VHHRIVSAAVKRIELVSDRLPYIVLKVRWGNFIVWNVHVRSEERRNDSKDRFYDKLEQVFDNFLKYHMKIPLGDFNEKCGERIFSNRQLEIVYIGMLMIMVLE
jgi:hypothetical protein